MKKIGTGASEKLLQMAHTDEHHSPEDPPPVRTGGGWLTYLAIQLQYWALIIIQCLHLPNATKNSHKRDHLGSSQMTSNIPRL